MKLHSMPALYKSSRLRGEVLVGSDDATTLLEASSAGDLPRIKTMLQRKDQRKIALASPHRIYSQSMGAGDVLARPILNLRTMIEKAATGNHAACVTALIAWGVEQQIPQSELLDRDLIIQALTVSGHEDFTLLSALADIDPYVLRHYLFHGSSVPRHALKQSSPALLRFLLQRGVTHAELQTACRDSYDGYWGHSPLAFAAANGNSGHMALLLQHGAEIMGSGALHAACANGNLDNAEFLLDRGAQIDEALIGSLGKRKPADIPMTPVECAVASGQQLITQWLQARYPD